MEKKKLIFFPFVVSLFCKLMDPKQSASTQDELKEGPGVERMSVNGAQGKIRRRG